jgi:hypothetical protein
MNVAQTVIVEINNAGDTVTTSPFQLIQWKHALKLEEKGLTMSRGRKVSTHLRKLLGLKRTTPIGDLQAWVEATLDAIEEAVA